MNLNWFFPVLILTVLILISGVFLMLRMIRVDRKIFNGEEASLRTYLIGSALTGACVFLLFVGMILVTALVVKDIGWLRDGIIWIIILGLAGGIMAMIGSLWRYFIAGKFRELLYQKLKEKYKK